MQNNNNEKKYHAPINIKFFDVKDGYIFDYIKGVNNSQQLTILLYTLSQCYYITANTPNTSIEMSRKFNAKNCFLKNLKQSNNKTLQNFLALEGTRHISKIRCEGETLDITFNPELFDLRDKANRFTICLNDLLVFKYLEHSIVYILTRYGKNKSFLYHNYLCKILNIEKLPYSRQKQKLKRIFNLLVKKGYLYHFEYKDYKCIFEREQPLGF
ncbi:hypothetical protein [Vibrio parahaemolyticus]|uniref:hypothetical protein n=1 Tax=Vibrio parahaemolyticus TaxID=670 RepID=UPI00111F3C2A|nr:hypothetical protein [Vibrio parahaemolyticus]MBE3808696.1 hypothetical protein [Vibrio parahaemolyticus]MBE4454954.1 hypothetical protein [Vibrio parahaemolyticus]TOG69358.1 hypothetical protein CGI96_00545 [Vibrio parahaemolyticus]TOR25705.1 hypothetical protein CGG77_23370 [Vibrio parahaemolyticus]TOR36646.1 hypothetical protein CGG77_04990 [Vibrio parahaemolyticus]